MYYTSPRVEAQVARWQRSRVSSGLDKREVNGNEQGRPILPFLFLVKILWPVVMSAVLITVRRPPIPLPALEIFLGQDSGIPLACIRYYHSACFSSIFRFQMVSSAMPRICSLKTNATLNMGRRSPISRKSTTNHSIRDLILLPCWLLNTDPILSYLAYFHTIIGGAIPI